MHSARAHRRFWKKTSVAPGGCIVWTADTSADGYGRFWHAGRLVQAHVFAYEAVVGPVPALEGADCRGTCLLHRCDNPRCVNPEHLTPGTHIDNMADMAAKGRRAVAAGALNGNARLTPEQVAEIRALEGHASARALGRRFGVSKTTIRAIQTGRQWRREMPA